MKNFIFTITKESIQRNGGCKVNARVYRIKNNAPDYENGVDVLRNTSSMKGEESEIMMGLVDAGLLPKKLKNTYYRYDNKQFRINKI